MYLRCSWFRVRDNLLEPISRSNRIFLSGGILIIDGAQVCTSRKGEETDHLSFSFIFLLDKSQPGRTYPQPSNFPCGRPGILFWSYGVEKSGPMCTRLASSAAGGREHDNSINAANEPLAVSSLLPGGLGARDAYRCLRPPGSDLYDENHSPRRREAQDFPEPYLLSGKSAT